ncbi:AN1-type zinc finger protein 2B isoform X7 [Calypte anna]|uniref:AN1-type zinc finger protein 2B isoform X7 n=1 Tax=Calypte anna TaxID=9244 RepID=UPI0011C4A444|nr:AN1-type zinc finger protein 2B isoform X7 [Calypte anna]
MEFPDLGDHCSWAPCQRLDFLPLKCDACEQIFCTDHIAYAQHDCTSAYKKDVQVPVCPLCNTPVPVRRGEMPDVVVGEHIDRDCKSDPAQRKRKIFTNKCLKPGCKQKEMMKVICDQCHKNYCLKHRHPLDHDCSGAGRPLSAAGVRKRHCSELWRYPWQSQHETQLSHPARRRRRIWHWPRHCQRAKLSTSSCSDRPMVQSHPTAACPSHTGQVMLVEVGLCL